MPESPDFDRIAAPLAEYADDTRRKQIAEQLRLVWNARGAADIAKIDALLHPLDDGSMTPGAVLSSKSLDRALRSLDR